MYYASLFYVSAIHVKSIESVSVLSKIRHLEICA